MTPVYELSAILKHLVWCEHAEIKQKVEVEYVVNHPTTMLRSTAAMLPADWSNPTRGARVLTNGGAIQYFSRDKESIR